MRNVIKAATLLSSSAESHPTTCKSTDTGLDLNFDPSIGTEANNKVKNSYVQTERKALKHTFSQTAMPRKLKTVGIEATPCVQSQEAQTVDVTKETCVKEAQTDSTKISNSAMQTEQANIKTRYS